MKVLFICTGNTCRSSMAEGIFNEIVKKKGLEHKASSAGTFAIDGSPATDKAIEALKEDYGIDISHHTSRSLKREYLKDADLVLTMTLNQRKTLLSMYPEFADKIFTVNEFAGLEGDIDDPFGLSKDVYKKTAKELYTSISRIIEKL
ncbi:low molecular weight protein arginine phosphatase [Thermoanaerobacterium sp. RBIITD]|uniref:low molecular weight protein arginine phosphatase n=1 Tax=Thermoanaerobacterium sp. RBIITD TaxID=1550240 RepID=UPI000BBF7DDE|nr:low molecular weight protein arginine phosphatase [Thermoanaerobacterium sp. RBIITD]SNX53560.1 protein-tyrosine phosphatase [Thermoanaerobacterium sp. RBIITD]